MACYSEYITINRTTPSRSGLYAEDLPGIDADIWDALVKAGQAEEDFWPMIYQKAWDNMISDLTHLLQNKFYVDSKLVSRETSQFKADVNMSADLAGVTIEFKLPRYARLHIVSADVFSDQAYTSPEALISVYDTDASGDLLSETSQELSEGRNTIFIDQDYEVNKVFVAFDPATYAFRETENKKYQTPYIYFGCNECAFDCGGYEGKIVQINGGGLNVRYNVVCSVEKFACENINFFRMAFWYRIGLELIVERIYGNRLNRFMTMTLDKQQELFNFYNGNYTENLERSVRSQNMREDPYCFSCKQIVSSRAQTP